jgi:hypothetical protein
MKKLLNWRAATLAVVLMSVVLTASAGIVTTLLLNASSTGAGTGVNYALLGGGIPIPNHWFQATLSGASAVSASVEIDGSTDNVNWVPITTLALAASPVASATAAAATISTAPFMRGNVTAISGIGATVTLRSGE